MCCSYLRLITLLLKPHVINVYRMRRGGGKAYAIHTHIVYIAMRHIYSAEGSIEDVLSPGSNDTDVKWIYVFRTKAFVARSLWMREAQLSIGYISFVFCATILLQGI